MDKTTLSTQLKDLFNSFDPSSNWTMDDNYSVKTKASFPDDPLALSCASYRIYKENPARRFTNIDLVNATQEDRIQAQAIRDYYNQRYTMKALKGKELTEYQKKTAQFLSGLYHLTTEEIGLLYKLPYFYDEDLLVEQVVNQTTSYTPQMTPLVAELKDLTEYELTPLVKVLISRKRSEFTHFYFKDQHGHAVLITCPHNDRFAYTLNKLFDRPILKVRANASVTDIHPENKHYVKRLNMWELVF